LAEIQKREKQTELFRKKLMPVFEMPGTLNHLQR